MSIYVTVLDYRVGETVAYKFFDNDFCSLSDDIETFLKNKGHVIKDIYYMVHRNPIQKREVEIGEDYGL